MISSSKASRDGPLMLATIRDDTWNMLNIQHITQKDPPTWLKVATTLEKPPVRK